MSSTVEVLADAFKEMGTPFIVGHPGGESVELMDAARERGMRFILMKQEVAGAMLAATWGEITGSPGVCLSTRGPGAANMVNGVAHAMLDRAPLIAITDRYSNAPQEIGLRQKIDHKALYTPIVKWSTTIDADAVRQQIRKAIRVATSPPPGAIHFDLPQDQTTREAKELPVAPPLLPNQLVTQPSLASLGGATDLLSGSSKPVVLVGLGAYWDEAHDEVKRFAEMLGAPVLTTSKCKGILSEDHSLRAGCVIGGTIERDLINQADLIITIGLDPIELQPKPWPYPTTVLAISNTPDADALVAQTLEVVGNIKSTLSVLIDSQSGQGDWGYQPAQSFREQVREALNVKSQGLSPQRAMEVVRAIAPRSTVATCDAGASRLLVVQKWESYGPREFLTSNGLGSMGFAIPGALAAKLAYPDRPVFAFTGDGGFLMAVAELQTSVKENLPITIIVLDDEELGLIRIKQELKEVQKYGISLGGIDWEKLAQGFGANGIVVSTEAQLQSAVSQAIGATKTTLIAVKIDGSGYVDQFNALREL
ncbi:thiamine pyrophosphate-binding protein [Litorivicinus sp.]|jgi:acetolactate synthase-1/2/3 large subunit|nr:thiamine pyrophosphate-binding protein [Litorivicinus sp.]